jgi:hypothetical protein
MISQPIGSAISASGNNHLTLDSRIVDPVFSRDARRNREAGEIAPKRQCHDFIRLLRLSRTSRLAFRITSLPDDPFQLDLDQIAAQRRNDKTASLPPGS